MIPRVYVFGLEDADIAVLRRRRPFVLHAAARLLAPSGDDDCASPPALAVVKFAGRYEFAEVDDAMAAGLDSGDDAVRDAACRAADRWLSLMDAMPPFARGGLWAPLRSYLSG